MAGRGEPRSTLLEVGLIFHRSSKTLQWNVMEAVAHRPRESPHLRPEAAKKAHAWVNILPKDTIRAFARASLDSSKVPVGKGILRTESCESYRRYLSRGSVRLPTRSKRCPTKPAEVMCPFVKHPATLCWDDMLGEPSSTSRTPPDSIPP